MPKGVGYKVPKFKKKEDKLKVWDEKEKPKKIVKRIFG